MAEAEAEAKAQAEAKAKAEAEAKAKAAAEEAKKAEETKKAAEAKEAEAKKPAEAKKAKEEADAKRNAETENAAKARGASPSKAAVAPPLKDLSKAPGPPLKPREPYTVTFSPKVEQRERVPPTGSVPHDGYGDDAPVSLLSVRVGLVAIGVGLLAGLVIRHARRGS